MDPLLPAIAELLGTVGCVEETPLLGSSIKALPLRSDLPYSKKVQALLKLSQTLNRTLLALKVESNQVEEKGLEPAWENAISTLIRECVSGSESQLSRAIDELMKREELFSSERLEYPVERDTEMLARAESALRDPPAPSVTYSARQPRLPGLPVPPGDLFGDWDEYRDDLDPGYRVRELYEEDYMREVEGGSESTSVTQSHHMNHAAMLDDELLHVSSEPSPVPVAVMDENDELSGAAVSVPHSQTPSMLAEIVCAPSERKCVESPNFGSSSTQTPAVKDSAQEIKTTLLYDAFATPKEVTRPPRCARLIREDKRNDTKAVHSRESLHYPLSTTDSQGRPIVLSELRLPVIYQASKTGFESSKEFDSTPGTIVAGRYRILGFLGAAAFSKCVKAVELETGREVCLKIIKNDKDFIDQSLDEIKVLELIREHDAGRHRCLTVLDYMYWKEHLVIVTELLLDNLYEFSKFNRNAANGQAPYFTLGRLQKITKQILTALQFVHSLGLIHCDLKPENVLFESYARAEVKVIDFGSSCFVTDRLSSYVQSRCYRAPEVLLGCLPYDQKVDLWSLGCIVAELWTGTVLFLNDSSQSLLARVNGILGPFPAWMIRTGRNVPNMFLQQHSGEPELFIELDAAGVVSGKGRLLQLLVPKKTSLFQRMRVEDAEFLSFLVGLLQVDPALRMTAEQALSHPWLCPGRYTDGL